MNGKPDALVSGGKLCRRKRGAPITKEQPRAIHNYRTSARIARMAKELGTDAWERWVISAHAIRSQIEDTPRPDDMR